MLAGAVVIDLGDAVANGVAAFAAVVSVIALFVADSRAKDANSIAVDANKTAREARDIAKEANQLTKIQHDYTVQEDRNRRHVQFRELVPPILQLFRSIDQKFETRISTAGASEFNLVEPSLNKIRSLLPGDSLFYFNGLILDARWALDRFQTFQLHYDLTTGYAINEESKQLFDDIRELTRSLLVHIGGIFLFAFESEYYLDWFNEPDRISRHFMHDLNDAYKAIEVYKIPPDRI